MNLTSASMMGLEQTRIKPWCTRKRDKKGFSCYRIQQQLLNLRWLPQLSSVPFLVGPFQSKHDWWVHVQRTHWADKTPQDGSFRRHGHQHLQDGPATRSLHPLTVLRKVVNLHNKEAFQQWCVHLWDLGERTQSSGSSEIIIFNNNRMLRLKIYKVCLLTLSRWIKMLAMESRKLGSW